MFLLFVLILNWLVSFLRLVGLVLRCFKSCFESWGGVLGLKNFLSIVLI